MKLREQKELQNKTLEELRHLAKEAKKEVFTMQMDLRLNKLKNTSSFASRKADVARMLTIIHEKEREDRVSQ